MIGWNYLDKTDATIEVLKDYDSIKFIIENTSDEIKRGLDKVTSVGVPKYDDHVRSGNVHSGEDQVVNTIEEIDILKERYRQAQEYMSWFEPAWKQLSEDEQYILENLYLNEAEVSDICAHFGIERKAFYMRKKRALDHLKTLLYGVRQ